MFKKCFIIFILIVLGFLLFYSNLDREGSELGEEVGRDSVTLLFVGDIMLDRGVSNALRREGRDYSFSGVRDLLSNADLLVGNLEGTFTNEASLTGGNSGILRFTFDPSLASMLKDFGFDGFSLANNHTLDFYQSGFDQTMRTLEAHDIFHFGSALNDTNLSYQRVFEDEVLCFVGYHSLFYSNTDTTLSEIVSIRDECDFITLFAHWGEEYQSAENESQRTLGRAFIDAGADLVIGSHPHVVQPVEIYKDKAIFYSLGNFLFDQDFSLATRQSVAVRVTLGLRNVEFELIPIEMSRAKLYYPEGESFAPSFEALVSKLPREIMTEVRETGHFRLPR